MPRAATATSTETSTDLVDAAQHALDLVGADPHASLAAADAVLARIPRARTADEVRAVVTAERAAGRSLRDLGRSQAGLARVRRGVSIADRKGLPAIAAEGRMTLSFLLLEQGRLGQALGTIDLALGSLDGLEAAKARTNRALILHRAGRPREALDEYAAALSVIRRAGDEYSEYVVRDNRAALFAEQGSTAEAVADLMWAREFALRQGRSVEAADTLWNLASLYAYAGDIPRGLELFDLADRELGDVDRPQRYTGRAEVLLDAGLAEEAREMARRGWRGPTSEAGPTLPRRRGCGSPSRRWQPRCRTSTRHRAKHAPRPAHSPTRAVPTGRCWRSTRSL